MEKIVLQQLAKRFKLLDDTKRIIDTYIPQAIFDVRDVKLNWDQAIITDHTVTHNKPDILLISKREKYAYIIEIGVPSDDNLHKMVAEKVRKHQELSEELKQLYKLDKVRVLPLVISTNGLVPEQTMTAVKDLDFPLSLLEEMQKAGLHGNASIIRKVILAS